MQTQTATQSTASPLIQCRDVPEPQCQVPRPEPQCRERPDIDPNAEYYDECRANPAIRRNAEIGIRHSSIYTIHLADKLGFRDGQGIRHPTEKVSPQVEWRLPPQSMTCTYAQGIDWKGVIA